MKKIITIVAILNSEDPIFTSDHFIEQDIKSEMGCCTNLYDIKTITTVEVE